MPVCLSRCCWLCACLRQWPSGYSQGRKASCNTCREGWSRARKPLPDPPIPPGTSSRWIPPSISRGQFACPGARCFRSSPYCLRRRPPVLCLVRWDDLAPGDSGYLPGRSGLVRFAGPGHIRPAAYQLSRERPQFRPEIRLLRWNGLADRGHRLSFSGAHFPGLGFIRPAAYCLQ